MSPNPDYVSAPYEESFLLGLPTHRPEWSRRRRLRHYRLAVRKALAQKRLRFQAFFQMGYMPEEKRSMIPVIFKHYA